MTQMFHNGGMVLREQWKYPYEDWCQCYVSLPLNEETQQLIIAQEKSTRQCGMPKINCRSITRKEQFQRNYLSTDNRQLFIRISNKKHFNSSHSRITIVIVYVTNQTKYIKHIFVLPNLWQK